MATNVIVQRPGSPWATWLGWGLLGGVLGVSGAILHDKVQSKPAPVVHVTYKPVADALPARVDKPLWGWWETLDASEPTSSFRVEYRNDSTFVAQPLEDAANATFLGHPLPSVGITGTYTTRRVGNGLKVQHRLSQDERAMPAAIVSTYGRTASLRFPGDALDSWVRLGRVDFGPGNELY